MSSALGHPQVMHDRPRGVALAFGWRRLSLALGVSILFGAANSLASSAPPVQVTIAHAVAVGLATMLAFGLFEQWPAKPRLPRWVLQVVGVMIAVPIGALLAHSVSMAIDIHSAHADPQMRGLMVLMVEGLLIAPWVAVAAMLQQRDIFARDQALAFELERSEFERKALDTRMRLLQAQVKPHFLFNTLANVQALVDAGSPQASQVLANLITYLRAAVPRMHAAMTMLAEELELVRAYLELMQMRMPDRLQFSLRIEPAASKLQCPPMTLLTLVENAVQHGIDPSEEGGRIDVDVWLRDDRCLVRVIDTGVGLKTPGTGLGTGLSTLRERMQLAFGGDAQLNLTEIQPRGVSAELNFPARPA
ncbi:hypothetical protein GCM10011487_20010 [Steroidobacter agaridevorans]|uniref:Histidine kinase/HSP90-like ATPase domain-containing protein n=1 Tax=Steroidobacter agaridevorans TaxID=2695856 RepID=A0A829YAN3_9GAMM|nr:histidine kinase [Steroidobacter agaridevorans]GFE80001.1 hypothetical protein GCM10011487_20010 [Steroidobacter agaridevorans]GFE90029.1 hypothetical protein GCM10011488_49830 [Steroidobacter agaridevorans]